MSSPHAFINNAALQCKGMTLTRPKHTTFSHQTVQEPRYHPSFAQINNLLDNIFLSATYQTLTELSTDIISGTRGLM